MRTPMPAAHDDRQQSLDFMPVEFRHPQADRQLILQGHLVAYEFRRARRRSIGFVIRPEGLSVSAPRWVGLDQVEAALLEKAGWILRKLHEQRERGRTQEASRISWVDGATIPYLGSNVVLVLDSAGDVQPGGAMLVEAEPPRLHVGLPQDAQPTRIRDAVHGWLQRQALVLFGQRCSHYAQQLGVRLKRVSLSNAQTRWGSANADGSIRLNWRLMHHGLPSIDYVVVHELAHLREMNHSPAFWDVVRSVLPEYEQAQRPLKQSPPLDD